jgi:hypothetical protein
MQRLADMATSSDLCAFNIQWTPLPSKAWSATKSHRNYLKFRSYLTGNTLCLRYKEPPLSAIYVQWVTSSCRGCSGGGIHFGMKKYITFSYRRTFSSYLEQWYLTWGKRGHLTGYVKLKKIYIFRDKHWIIGVRFRVNHKRPGSKDIRLTGQNHINNW